MLELELQKVLSHHKDTGTQLDSFVTVVSDFNTSDISLQSRYRSTGCIQIKISW